MEWLFLGYEHRFEAGLRTCEKAPARLLRAAGACRRRGCRRDRIEGGASARQARGTQPAPAFGQTDVEKKDGVCQSPRPISPTGRAGLSCPGRTPITPAASSRATSSRRCRTCGDRRHAFTSKRPVRNADLNDRDGSQTVLASRKRPASAQVQPHPESSLKRAFRKSMNTLTRVGICWRLGKTAKMSSTVGW